MYSGFNSSTHSPLSLARIQALRHPVLACYNVRARRRHTGCRRTPGVRVGGGQTSNLPSASGLNVGGGDRLCLGRGVLRPRCVEGSRGRCGGKATGDARSPAGGATARHRGRGPSARAGVGVRVLWGSERVGETWEVGHRIKKNTGGEVGTNTGRLQTRHRRVGDRSRHR